MKKKNLGICQWNIKKKEAKNSPVVKNPKFSISNHTLLKFFLSFQYSSNVISQEPY